MRSELQAAFADGKPAHFAISRDINTPGAAREPELTTLIPNMSTQATRALRLLHVAADDRDQEMLNELFGTLKSIGEALLYNDEVFNYLSGFLTCPQKLLLIRKMCDGVLAAFAEAQREIEAGNVVRAKLISVPEDQKLDFHILGKKYSVEPVAIDFIMTGQVYQSGAPMVSCVPIFEIKDQGDLALRLGVDIDAEGNLIFVESAAVDLPNSGELGVAFVRPEEVSFRKINLWSTPGASGNSN